VIVAGEPFGRPFAYTDANDLGRPPPHPRWWVRLGRKLRPPPKVPLAYLAVTPEHGVKVVVSYGRRNGKATRLSAATQNAVVPLYTIEEILAAAELEVPRNKE
jgi:hypothetical protein